MMFVLSITLICLHLYNIHCLVHLATDASKYGCLDNFSAFPFENELKNLKSLLRKPSFPLAQLERRLAERRRASSDTARRPAPGETAGAFIPCKPHAGGPCPAEFLGAKQFLQVKSQRLFLSTANSDNVFLTPRGLPARVRNILQCNVNSEIVVVYEEFRVVDSLFEYPLRSSDLGIFKVSQLGARSNLLAIPVMNIATKCVCLPCNDERSLFAIFPLLHQT